MNTKDNLEKIYRELRQDARQMWIRALGILGGNSPKDEVELSAVVLDALRDPWFEEFIRHPQVDNLIVDTICYHFAHMENRKQAEDTVLTSRVCNCCLQLLQTVWAEEQGWDQDQKDRITRAFRQFWSQLLYVNGPNAKILSEHADYVAEIATVECQSRKMAIEREIEAEFVAIDPAAAKTLKRYKNGIKARYNKGFIYMLGEYPFNEFYISPTIIPGGMDQFQGAFINIGNRELWKNIFETTNVTYVIGVPGSGKSLFLQNVINNYEKMNFYRSKDYLVIKCDMKTYYKSGNDDAKSVLKFLQESIINTLGVDQTEVSASFIKYYISMGRCLVLMDALDEVPKSGRERLHKMIVSYFKAAHPGNKVIITSRARGFIPQEKIEVYQIRELSNQDIKDYIKKMIQLKKFKKEDEEKFLQQAQALIEKHFLNNFLTLSLLTGIYKAEKELPENKVNLYKKCFEYIAKKREEEKAQLNYDWEKIRPMMKDSTFISLAELAAPNNKDIGRQDIEKMLMGLYKNKYVDEAKAESAIQEFLDFCSNRTELFVLAQTEEKFRFFHRSFFEYFYARLIAQKTSVEEMYQSMTQFDIDSEVFELTVAIVKEENERKYQQLIEYIFDQIELEFKTSSPVFTAFGILTLSIQVIDDIGYHKKYFQIVVDHANLMETRSVMALNQKLIALGVQKVNANYPEQAQRFCELFRDRYISYVVRRFAEADSRRFFHMSFAENFRIPMKTEERDRFYSGPVQREEVPFYLQGYPAEEAAYLESEVLGWSVEEIKKFISLHGSKKERKQLQKGFANILNCDVSQRNKLWRFYANHVPSTKS